MTNIFTIKIPKAGIERSIDFDELPVASRQFIIAYGARQLLNDATAPVNETSFPDPAKRLVAAELAVDKKMQRLIDGDLETRAVGVRGDKTRTMAINLALGFAPGKDPKKKRANAIFMVESNPRWMQLAREAIDNAEDIATGADETDDLVPGTELTVIEAA